MEAMRLWKSAEEAKKVIQEALQNCKNDAELEYHLSLALAEIYIFQVCNFPDPCCKQKPSDTTTLNILRLYNFQRLKLKLLLP